MKPPADGESQAIPRWGGTSVGSGAVEPGTDPGRNRTLTVYLDDRQQQISGQFPGALALVDNTGEGQPDKSIAQHNVSQNHLSAVKSFRPFLRCMALHSAQPQNGLQRIFRKPFFNSLSLKDIQNVPNLLPAD